MKSLIFLLPIIFHLEFCLAQQDQVQKVARFSRSEVTRDLKFLYETLEKAHYNLYVNTKKETFERVYKRIYNSVPDSLSLIQITRLFQPFVALSGLAHCSIGFPFEQYFSSSNQDTARVLPFSIAVLKGHAFITDSYVADSSLQSGDEVLSIDVIPVQDKLLGMYKFLSGEGDEIKNTLIDLFTFPRVYWWVYDSHKSYTINVRTRRGTIKSVRIEGMKAAEYEQKSSSRKPVFDLNRQFKFFGDVAYLHPGVFINNQSSGNTSEQSTFETNEFISFIDSSFREIYKAKSKSLIIDLRGNPGGDNAFSDPMIAYFATKPFRFCSSFNVKTSSITKEFWKDVKDTSLQQLKNQILTRKDGETFEASFPNHLPRNDSLFFKGRVYILVDKYSYSNSVSVAAIVQDYHFGKVVGEPTADVASSYGATHQFKLPYSQLNVSYPKAFIVRPNGDKALKGVTPDVIVEDDVFTDRDEILDFAIKYIKGH